MYAAPNTYLALLIEFGTAHIPLAEFAKRYLDIDEEWANKQAKNNKLPFPVFRAGGQKSPWFIDIKELADYLDTLKARAKREFNDTQL